MKKLNDWQTNPTDRTAGSNDDEVYDGEIIRQARVEWARRCAKRKDILEWGKALFPEKFYLPFCQKLHGYFIQIRAEPFTNTEAPRNHAKTLIKCVLIPMFQALEEPDLFRHYLNVQATKVKALAVNTSIKAEFEGNTELRELYGDMMGERWTDQQFVLSNGVIFTSIGAGESIRGINYHSIRPDYEIVDDLYDESEINNAEATEKKNAWFWGSLYPARAKSRRCSVHVQGTAINPYDLLEKLKKQKRWKSASFQSCEDWDQKIVLWPELNTFESLQADKIDMGSLIFGREMQNERLDETTSRIKRSWLTSWEYDPAELRLRLVKEYGHFFIVAKIIGNDPSIGKDSEDDPTGTALVIKTGYDDGTGNDYWIDGLWNEQLSLEKRVQQLESIAAGQPADSPVTHVEIEAISGFDDYASTVIRRTNLPVHRVEWVKDKLTNLENKSHYFENGKVHLNKNIDPDLKDKLVHQLTNNHPKHDDLRDGVLLTLDDTSGLWNFVK
jgi:hypothetical protein